MIFSCDGWRTADLVSRLQLAQAEAEKVLARPARAAPRAYCARSRSRVASRRRSRPRLGVMSQVIDLCQRCRRLCLE